MRFRSQTQLAVNDLVILPRHGSILRFAEGTCREANALVQTAWHVFIADAWNIDKHLVGALASLSWARKEAVGSIVGQTPSGRRSVWDFGVEAYKAGSIRRGGRMSRSEA